MNADKILGFICVHLCASAAYKEGVSMTEMRKQKRSQAGVTLIEMLVVVTIIALFAALVGPKLFQNADKAKVTAAKAQINSLMTALVSYKLEGGAFPTTEQRLQALWT